MMKYGFGVDIGGTTCKMGLFETNGQLLEKWEIPTRTEDCGSKILADVAKAIDDKLEELGIAKEEVKGIGIGIPGPVNEEGVVNGCVNLGWGVVDVVSDLGKMTGLVVKAGNDANVAALGEMWQGGGKGFENIIMVTLGTGVGGGVVIGGKMVAGTNGAGGEIGHMFVNGEETETCGCGKKGCLEQYSSATGIVRMAKKKMIEEERPTLLSESYPLTAKDVFDAAKANDTVALEVVEENTKILGTALAQIACVVDPEVFVIGGGVSKAGQIILNHVQKYYKERTFYACRNAEFKLAELGNDAGMYGCAEMIID